MATMIESTRPATTNTRRSFTLPPRLPTTLGDASGTDATGAETLFAHPAARVVSFSASKVLGLGQQGKQDVGTLPWTSRSERVISLGPLRIYRLRGSVAFLHAGSLLLSLLPRSQCWCVDGESKFAMRIQHLIYRIELPFSTEEERAQVEELKDVLGRILLYEKTACPFRRGFEVELPEEIELSPPRRKKVAGSVTRAKRWEMKDIWRREGENYRPATEEIAGSVDEKGEGRDVSDTDVHEDTSYEETLMLEPNTAHTTEEEEDGQHMDNEEPYEGTSEQNRNTRHAKKEAEKQPPGQDNTKPPIRPRDNEDRSDGGSTQTALLGKQEPHTELQQEAQSASMGPDRPETSINNTTPSQPQYEHNRRSIPLQTTADNLTKPELPQASTATVCNVSADETQLDNAFEPEPPVPSAERSRASSVRSYYTSLELQPSSLPSPMFEYKDPFETTSMCRHDASKIQPAKITDATVGPEHMTALPTSKVPCQLDSTIAAFSPDVEHPVSTPRHRTSTTASDPDMRRTTSHATPAYLSTGTNVTSAFLSKTAALFLGPPSGLVSAMIQIASRLANGGLDTASSSADNVAYRFRLDGLPGRWEDSEEERDDDDDDDDYSVPATLNNRLPRNEVYDDDDDFEDLEEDDEQHDLDDFGVPLGNDTPAREGRKNWGFVKSPVKSPAIFAERRQDSDNDSNHALIPLRNDGVGEDVNGFSQRHDQAFGAEEHRRERQQVVVQND